MLVNSQLKVIKYILNCKKNVQEVTIFVCLF